MQSISPLFGKAQGGRGGATQPPIAITRLRIRNETMSDEDATSSAGRTSLSTTRITPGSVTSGSTGSGHRPSLLGRSFLASGSAAQEAGARSSAGSRLRLSPSLTLAPFPPQNSTCASPYGAGSSFTARLAKGQGAIEATLRRATVSPTARATSSFVMLDEGDGADDEDEAIEAVVAADEAGQAEAALDRALAEAEVTDGAEDEVDVEVAVAQVAQGDTETRRDEFSALWESAFSRKQRRGANFISCTKSAARRSDREDLWDLPSSKLPSHGGEPWMDNAQAQIAGGYFNTLSWYLWRHSLPDSDGFSETSAAAHEGATDYQLAVAYYNVLIKEKKEEKERGKKGRRKILEPRRSAGAGAGARTEAFSSSSSDRGSDTGMATSSADNADVFRYHAVPRPFVNGTGDLCPGRPSPPVFLRRNIRDPRFAWMRNVYTCATRSLRVYRAGRTAMRIAGAGQYVKRDSGSVIAGLQAETYVKAALTPGQATPWILERIRQLTCLNSTSMLVDVGHGEGAAVLPLAALTGCSAYGVEVVPSRARDSLIALQGFLSLCRASRDLAVLSGERFEGRPSEMPPGLCGDGDEEDDDDGASCTEWDEALYVNEESGEGRKRGSNEVDGKEFDKEEEELFVSVGAGKPHPGRQNGNGSGSGPVAVKSKSGRMGPSSSAGGQEVEVQDTHASVGPLFWSPNSLCAPEPFIAGGGKTSLGLAPALPTSVRCFGCALAILTTCPLVEHTRACPYAQPGNARVVRLSMTLPSSVPTWRGGRYRLTAGEGEGGKRTTGKAGHAVSLFRAAGYPDQRRRGLRLPPCIDQPFPIFRSPKDTYSAVLDPMRLEGGAPMRSAHRATYLRGNASFPEFADPAMALDREIVATASTCASCSFLQLPTPAAGYKRYEVDDPSWSRRAHGEWSMIKAGRGGQGKGPPARQTRPPLSSRVRFELGNALDTLTGPDSPLLALLPKQRPTTGPSPVLPFCARREPTTGRLVVLCNNFGNAWMHGVGGKGSGESGVGTFQQRLFRLLSRSCPAGSLLVSCTRMSSPVNAAMRAAEEAQERVSRVIVAAKGKGANAPRIGLPVGHARLDCAMDSMVLPGEAPNYYTSVLYIEVSGGWPCIEEATKAARASRRGGELLDGLADESFLVGLQDGVDLPRSLMSSLTGSDAWDGVCESVWLRGRQRLEYDAVQAIIGVRQAEISRYACAMGNAPKRAKKAKAEDDEDCL